MATPLMQVCMSIQDEYWKRYQTASENYDAQFDKNSRRARELRDLRSLYGAIVVAAINAMPDGERLDAARRLGITIDELSNRVLELA